MEEKENPSSAHIPDISSCRCGCVPASMMSLFQMAELRAKRKAELKQKEEQQKAILVDFPETK